MSENEMSFVTIKVEAVEDQILSNEVLNNNGNQEVKVEDSTEMKVIEVLSENGVIDLKAEPVELMEEDEEDALDEEFDEELNFEDSDPDNDFESDDNWIGTSPETDLSSPGLDDSDKEDGINNDEENEVDIEGQDSSFDFNGVKIVTKGNYSECPRCNKNIKSTFILRHIKLHDQPIEKYKCPEKDCSLVVSRINNLFRHLKIVHKSKKPYFCKHTGCSETFSKPKQLRDHFTTHRSERRAKEKTSTDNDGDEVKIFTCEFPGCGKEYGKRHHLREHERKHTGDMRYACDVCGKKFFIQAHMKRHLYSHTGIKPHVCRWKCGAIFASYGGRMKHERINHYEENPLQSDCDICGRPFRNQQQLTKHRMTHLNPSERLDYRCSFCGIMLDTIKLRERHEERHRDGETFTCETCHRSFKNEKNLTHHYKKHHTTTKASTSSEKNDKQQESSATPAKKESKKDDSNLKHACHLCGPPKLFCLTSLRRHLARIHSQNFKCDRPDCGKGFKEKIQFDAHMEIHRMRECHLCAKKFRRKQNADIHLMGVHNLTAADLEQLGRWKSKSKDPTHCPDYMTRTARNKKKRELKVKKSLTSPQLQQPEEWDDMIEIKSEPIYDIEDSEEEEEEESIIQTEPESVQQSSSNITYIIAHGPNGLISIPTNVVRK